MKIRMRVKNIKKILFLLFSSPLVSLLVLIFIILMMFLIHESLFWKLISLILVIGLNLVNFNLNYSAPEKAALTSKKRYGAYPRREGTATSLEELENG